MSGLARTGGATLFAACSAVLLSASLACSPMGDCYAGVGLGDHVEIELVDRYVEDGPYPWSDAGNVGGLASCEAVDGLSAGARLGFTVDGRTGSMACWAYGVVPDEPIWDLTFDEVRVGGGAYLSAQVAREMGYWQFVVLRDARRHPGSPLGQEAVPGEDPPIVVRRTISDLSTACADAWVAEIRELPAADGTPVRDE